MNFSHPTARTLPLSSSPRQTRGSQRDARPGARQPSTGLPAATTAAGASTDPPSGKSQRWSTPTPGPSITRLARDLQEEKQRRRHRSRRKLCLSRTTHLLFTAHRFCQERFAAQDSSRRCFKTQNCRYSTDWEAAGAKPAENTGAGSSTSLLPSQLSFKCFFLIAHVSMPGG